MDDQELKLFLEESKRRFTSGNSKSIFKKIADKTFHLDSRIFYDFLGS